MASVLYFQFLLFLFPFFVVAQNRGNVSIGDFLIAADEDSPWLSPSNHFAFGFKKLNDQDNFLLAIWYDKIPDKTIVWHGNEGKPVPRGSKIQLTADRGLVLSSPEGEQMRISDFPVGAVSYGLMNDTGNFVLENRNSQLLWQSFDHPTDSLLPTQVMEINGVLSSRRSETNFSRGRFLFRLGDNGNVVMNSINLPSNNTYDAYYSRRTGDEANISNSGYRVIFDVSGHLYILRRSGERINLTPEQIVPASDYYHKATLHFDGVFTISHHPKDATGNASWTAFKTIPENICLSFTGGSGVCGYNSVCTLKSDDRPICKCPQGFSLLDPNDVYGSCKPEFNQGCDAEENGQVLQKDLSNFLVLPNTDWPRSDYEFIRPYNMEDCKKSCSQDCLCYAAVFRTDSCWKKKLPLSNGREGGSVNGWAFLKVRNVNSTQFGSFPSFPAPKKDQDTLIIVLSVLLGGSVFVIFILVGVFCFCVFFLYHKKISRLAHPETAMEVSLHHFPYKELEEATKGFKEELGRGSFGTVYKGLIEMGSRDPIAIAVKKLHKVVQDSEKEFKTEVNVIGQTHHKNLVRLLGYCHEGQQQLLVYEFLSNGTLASFLFGDLKPSWHQRTQIALGIGRGLVYLHEECSSQVIHCDIKPQNILLDDYYNARISDFGLAKLLAINQSNTNTAIRGTKGYVAPEWFRAMPVTVKVDVYSFGVVLLEIICCRKNIDVEMGEGDRTILTDWAYDCYQEGKLDDLVDNDVEALTDMRKLERLVMVAILCIQEDPSLRPTMKKAMLMLEGIVQVPVPPCPFAFSYSNN